MATGQLSGVIRHLRRVALLPDCGGTTDGQLLECFITRRDEAAFEALVRRHGPMVLGVCRRVLGNHHDAEDAFQATFLVLARKAPSIGQRELVGNWLYGAAYRAALEAKAARRRVTERQVRAMPELEAVAEADGWLDLRPILDQELSRLPDKYRLPVVLCDLEGRTRRDVARHLDIPAGTLSGRLTTARRLLAKRLARHGFVLSGGALAAALSQSAASACVPSPLVGSTVKAAILLAAGQAAPAGLVSAKVAALTEGVLKAMLLTKLKIATAVLLVGVLGVGVAMLALPALATGQTDVRKAGKPEPAPKQPELAAKKADQAQAPKGWKERLAIKAPEKSQAFALAVSADGKTIAVNYGTATRIMDATTGKERLRLSETEKWFPDRSVAFSPDGKRIALSGDDADVLLCSAASGEVKARLEYPKPVVMLAFSPDGKVLATSVDHVAGDEVRLWDLATNQVRHEFQSRARSLAFSADGKKLAIAECSDSTAKVWDVETGKELATFGKFPDQVLAVAFSPDGRTLAAANAGEDPNVKLWDVATGKERLTLKGPTCMLQSLAFSPDGKVLAVAGEDDRIGKTTASVVRLWDPATGKPIADLNMQGDRTHWPPSLGFSRNGMLVTASDAAVRIWEMEKK